MDPIAYRFWARSVLRTLKEFKMASGKNSLDQFAVDMATWVIKLRWLVLVAVLAVTGLIATGAQHLAFSNNYRVFFSKENPELRNFEEFQATYVKSDNLLFVVKPRDGSDIFTNENLRGVLELTERGWLLPFSTRVDSVTNFQYTYAQGDELIVEDLVPSAGALSEETLAQKRAAALAEPLLNGQLITAESKVTTVNVVLTYPEKSLSEVPEAVFEARALRADIESKYPNLEVYLSGTSMLNNAFSEAVISDFGLLIPVMIVVILVTTALAIKSISATAVTLVLVILSTIIALGWAGFAGIKLSGPSPSSVIVILTLAIADSIHILISARSAMRAGMEKRAAIIEAIRINFLAVSITSVTTIVGFMALNFADSPPFRDFGNISAVGILAAWALSLTLLPALLSLIPLRVKAVSLEENESTFMSGLADFVTGNYRKLFFITGAGALAIVTFIPQIEFSDQFRMYFDDRIEFRRETDKIVDHFGFYPMEFSIKAGEPGGVSDPEFLEKLEAFGNWLREDERVAHVYSIADIMKRLNKNLNGDDPDYYRLPDDRELSAQYLLLFEISLPYGLDLNDRINIDKSATRLTATLGGDTDTRQIRALLKDTQAWFDENAPEFRVSPTGAQIMFTFIAKRNVESMITGTLIAIAAIAVIMMAALRSVSIGLLSIVPNGLPILTAFGAWAILVGHVGFSVAAVASLSLGIVIDDTVHFLTKFLRAQREKGLSCADSIRYAFETVGVAIIVNTFVLAAGFIVISFSSFQINAEMGLLTTLSIGFALILDFLFLPALLMMLAKDPTKAAVAAKGGTYA